MPNAKWQTSQMTTPIRILGIAGGLPRGSYNRAALRAATEFAPKQVPLVIEARRPFS
jgi:NAD(P)H-dependent FMN reductase